MDSVKLFFCRYHSGGAGYVLSKETFKRFGSKLKDNVHFCPNRSGFEEDVNIAKCLRLLNVYPNSSIDKDNRERFHPFTLDKHYKGTWPKGLENMASNPLRKVTLMIKLKILLLINLI